jgi:hypothetical protein
MTHTWYACCCVGLFATFGAACPCGADESRTPTAQTAAADAPTALAALQAQLEQAKAARDANELLLGSLQRAVEDLSSLATVRNQVFDAYPTLQRLHLQWSDVYAQRQSLLETLLPAHPRVQLCLAKEEALLPHLQRELRTARDAASTAQPLLDAQVADLAKRVTQRAAPAESRTEPETQPPHAPPQPPSRPADQPQHLAELEARTAALARAEQALAAAQARIAAAASNTPTVAESPRGGDPIHRYLATGITGGLVAGGFVGLALILVTARLTRSGTRPASTVPVPPPRPLPREVSPPAAIAPVLERTKPSAIVEPVREQSTPAVPAAAAAIAPPPEPPAPVTPAVTAPTVRPLAAPISPVVTVPISELSPSPRRPNPLPPRPGARANRSASRMTLKDALVRCAETAAAQSR